MIKIGKHSWSKVYSTLEGWSISRETWEPGLNYLLHVWEPGSFYTSMFANDMLGALSCCHPANSILELKNFGFWIRSHWPRQAYGSYENVNSWLKKTSDERKLILVDSSIIYSDEEEIIQQLKGEPYREFFIELGIDLKQISS